MRGAKKVLHRFALVVAGALSGLSIVTTSAEDTALQQMLPLYNVSPANNLAVRSQAEREQRFEKLQSGAYGKLENFTAKARLVFKTAKWPMVEEARTFTLESPVATRASEWRQEGMLYVWRGDMDARAHPLTIMIVPEKNAKPFHLDDFNEFWLDYTSSPGVPLCTPQIKFQAGVLPDIGDSRALQDFVTRTSDAPYLLETLATIDATRANWKEKEYGYLVGRVLGLAHDDDWRYVQSQINAVMQRRLHVPLDNVNVLDISLSPGTKVERVNLMVGREDDYRAGELVEFADVQQNISLSDGRQGIRLNLRGALEERFANEWTENAKDPGKHHLYLQEVIIFIPGEARVIGEVKPVHSLVFLGNDTGERTQKSQSTLQQQTLASNVIAVNAYRQRMVVDLRKLVEKGKADLKKAELRLLPPYGAAFCAFRIEEVRAVSTYNGSVPAFARMAEDWSRRWGGIFNLTAPQQDQIEHPGIVAYMPLSILTHPEMKYVDGMVEEGKGLAFDWRSQALPRNDQVEKLNVVTYQPPAPLPLLNANKAEKTEGGDEEGTRDVPDSLLKARQPLLLYRILGNDRKAVTPDRRRLVSSNGASLGSVGKMPHAIVEGDQLVLEGRSQALEIAWPLAARINENTRLYFGVTEGVEQIGDITLTLDLADGSVIRRRVVPNQPFRLIERVAEIRHIRLRIFPAVTPYRFKLREIALFAPSAASYAQAFTIPLPTQYTVVPKPVLQSIHTSVLEARPGHVAGLVAGLTAGEPLRFSTPLDPALDWVRGVRLNYRLPPTYADGEVCPLTLQFIWANGKTERQVCFEKLDGALFIPMASWLGRGDKLQNLGALQSIDWTLRLSGRSNRGLTESFDLQFSVEGWAMLSAADHLRLSPLFYAGRHAVFADAEHIKEIAAGRNSQRNWVSLEEKALSRMLSIKDQIRPVDHWLFALDQVVAEPKRPMIWERWRELTELPTQYAPLRWPKWLIWASATLLAWATWKKGWWSPGKVWALGKGGVKVFIRVLRWVLGVAGRWGWQALPNINLAIGVLALGPGLWLAGQLGLGFIGVMVLAASGLVVWGAYCHWREQMEQRGISTMMNVRLGILVVTLGCGIWSLGKYKLGVEALWGFLPLFGAVYALLPALYRLGQWLARNYRGCVSLGGWFVLTLTLYGVGLLVKVRGGENYFFIFGGLAAFFALRAGLLAIEPRFRDIFPAVAKHVYGGAGSLYFSGALVVLVMTAMVLSVGLQPIAEQLAIVVYYCLVVGVVKEAWVLRIAH